MEVPYRKKSNNKKLRGNPWTSTINVLADDVIFCYSFEVLIKKNPQQQETLESSSTYSHFTQQCEDTAVSET